MIDADFIDKELHKLNMELSALTQMESAIVSFVLMPVEQRTSMVKVVGNMYGASDEMYRLSIAPSVVLESLSETDVNRICMEGLINTIGKFFKAIMNFFKNLYKKIVDFFRNEDKKESQKEKNMEKEWKNKKKGRRVVDMDNTPVTDTGVEFTEEEIKEFKDAYYKLFSIVGDDIESFRNIFGNPEVPKLEYGLISSLLEFKRDYNKKGLFSIEDSVTKNMGTASSGPEWLVATRDALVEVLNKHMRDVIKDLYVNKAGEVASKFSSVKGVEQTLIFPEIDISKELFSVRYKSVSNPSRVEVTSITKSIAEECISAIAGSTAYEYTRDEEKDTVNKDTLLFASYVVDAKTTKTKRANPDDIRARVENTSISRLVEDVRHVVVRDNPVEYWINERKRIRKMVSKAAKEGSSEELGEIKDIERLVRNIIVEDFNNNIIKNNQNRQNDEVALTSMFHEEILKAVKDILSLVVTTESNTIRTIVAITDGSRKVANAYMDLMDTEIVKKTL